MSSLPAEIVIKIFNHLDLNDLTNARLTCKSWLDVTQLVLNKITHVKVNPERHEFPLRTILLFQSDYRTVFLEDVFKFNQLCLFLAKNCSNLSVLDAPTCSIDTKSLLALTQLEYLCVYSTSPGIDAAYFADIAVNKMCNLKALDFTDRRNVLKVSLFYHGKSKNGMGKLIRWQHLLGMNNYFIPEGIHSLTTLSINNDLVQMLHDRAGNTLRYLDLQLPSSLSMSSGPSGCKDTHFPHLTCVILKSFHVKYEWFLSILERSTRLHYLYLTYDCNSAFAGESGCRFISHFSELKYLSLVNECKVSCDRRSETTIELNHSSLSRLEVINEGFIKIIFTATPPVESLTLMAGSFVVSQSVFSTIRHLKLGPFVDDPWVRPQDATPDDVIITHLHAMVNLKELTLTDTFDENPNHEWFSRFLTHLFDDIAPRLTFLEVKIDPSSNYVKQNLEHSWTVKVTRLPLMERLILSVCRYAWTFVIPKDKWPPIECRKSDLPSYKLNRLLICAKNSSVVEET